MSSAQKAPRVFVVDDEPMIAWTVAEILRQAGFDTTCFTSPEEALRNTASDIPDPLLSDVVMPRLTGIELAIQVRQLCPACRILLLSGQAATRQMLDQANENGQHFDMLPKPIHPEVLVYKVRRALLTES